MAVYTTAVHDYFKQQHCYPRDVVIAVLAAVRCLRLSVYLCLLYLDS